MQFTETVKASLLDDGFVELSLERTYPHGAKYMPTVYFQVLDVPELADAIERFARTTVPETVPLSDGEVNLFCMTPNPLINLELKRPSFGEHGGYRCIDMGPKTVPSLVAALREAADQF